MNFVIITNNLEIERSFTRYLKEVLKIGIDNIKIINTLETDLKNFKHVCDEIENFALKRGGYQTLRETVVLFDPLLGGREDVVLLDPKWGTDLTPLIASSSDGEKYSVSGFFASLVLAFPEAYWVLISPPWYQDEGEKEKDKDKIEGLLMAWHYLEMPGCTDNGGESEGKRYFEVFIDRISSGYIPLFDPTGLRALIRRNMKPDERIGDLVSVRGKLAASVDEENPYVYFNSYTEFRFGYRVWAINTRKMMKRIFDNKENAPHVELLFEDLYLNFPDRPSDEGYSKLNDRENKFPNIKDVPQRVFVTVGHRLDPETHRINREHIDRNRDSNKKFRFIFKPYAGIFDLWKKSKQWNKGTNRAKYADKFRWPPLKTVRDKPDASHSAPGRLLIIADRLLNRARKLLSGSRTVPDAIHSATLALEAKELLVDRTPTIALDALSLQHQAEVLAESFFPGVEYNISLKERFDEIRREVKYISHFFAPHKLKRALLNSQLLIVEALAQRFRELNQFEEEHLCLSEARKLRFEFWVRQRPWRWIVYPILRYIEFSLRSITKFAFVITLWLIFFGLIYYMVGPPGRSDCQASAGFLNAFAASMVYFLTLQSADCWQPSGVLWNVIAAFQGLISFLNLSLLISHLYMIISRR